MIKTLAALFSVITLFLPLQAVAIDKDEALEFKGTWEGPDSTKHSLHGVKITIKDKTAGASPDITGFVLNGKFAFTSPRDNYTFDVILESTFPGVSGSGAVASGGGVGAFVLKKGIITTNAAGSPISTAPGNVYTFNLGQKLDHNAVQTKAQKVVTTASEGDVWAAFHGMADMVKEGKKQLAVDKTAFTLVFPAHGSNFDRVSLINLLRLDRYDWDVVAHEFGHAIGKDANAEAQGTSPGGFASPGGPHDLTNQYDYAQNAGTLNNKKGALGLAF